ncbi:CHAD domain-containing protein [Amorphus sp. 3PC139-8]|uniref:CHAD domain-containing protein n=1 Tax=Amorphus sp. 3PC139-8 TaxID=2735676 RepID=UPI00345CF9CB
MANKTSRATGGSLDAKRVLAADLAAARKALEDEELEREACVHVARRRLKHARSMLRILRPVLGDDYDRRRIVLRDAAAALSGTRDLDVMAVTCAKLAEHAPERVQPALSALRAALLAEAERAHAEETPIAAVVDRLRAAEAETQALPDPDDPAGLFAHELAHAYKAARKAMDAARAHHGEHPFHEWRKRVKHHWHLSQMAESECDLVRKKGVKRLDKLGETLGLENDHAVLQAKLLDDPLLAGEGASADRIHDLIDVRRAKLQDKALRLGDKIYAPAPGDVRAEIEAIWPARGRAPASVLQ